MKNESFLRLFFLLFLISFSFDLTCSVKVKNTISTVSKGTQVTTQKSASIDPQEKAIIEEIKSLLKHGKVPSLSFTQWVDTHAPILLQSNKEPVKTLGKTLKAIRQGNTAQISAFKVLPQFDKAVQVYDPEFKRSMLGTPGLIAKGTYWYFSSPKKTQRKN